MECALDLNHDDVAVLPNPSASSGLRHSVVRKARKTDEGATQCSHNGSPHHISSSTDVMDQLLIKLSARASCTQNQVRSRCAPSTPASSEDIDVVTLSDSEDVTIIGTITNPKFHSDPSAGLNLTVSNLKLEVENLNLENTKLVAQNNELMETNLQQHVILTQLQEEKAELQKKVVVLEGENQVRKRKIAEFEFGSGGGMTTVAVNANQNFVCKICRDEQTTVLFLPCKHLISCGDCAQLVAECPVCRAVIMQKLAVFQS